MTSGYPWYNREVRRWPKTHLIPIQGTCDPELYRSVVEGAYQNSSRHSHYPIKYSLPVTEGNVYHVTLKFAELLVSVSKTYERLFDIYIDGNLKEKDFSIAKQAGPVGVTSKFTALDMTYVISASSNVLIIELKSSQYYGNCENAPMICAIVVSTSPDGIRCVEPIFSEYAVMDASNTSSGNVEDQSMTELEFVAEIFSENLVRNSCGEAGDLTGWDQKIVGGNGWSVSQISGIDKTSSCFCSSHGMCVKEQKIDLLTKGFTSLLLDKKPAIVAGEVAMKGHGKCPYVFEIELLDESNEVIDRYKLEKTLTDDEPTITTHHEFRDYSRPCRYVVIRHGGKDGVFWAGHFGTKVTLSSVRVAMGSAIDEENEKLEEIEALADSNLKNLDVLTLSRPLIRRPKLDNKRNVRLFVSSTFLDFIAERDYLSRNTFLELRLFCEKRGISFNEIDLRWGVTSDQSGSGKVIQLCFDELDKCRPYFMCMLGERYGWSQNIGNLSGDKLLKDTYDYAISLHDYWKWIDEYRDRSTTELEIRYACLNDLQSATATRAIFFFRNPKGVGAGSIYQGEDETRTARSQSLKKEIIEAGYAPIRYDKPEELGTAVLRHFKTVIAKDFPIEEKPTELDKEWAAHNAFAAFRARCYLPTGNYFARLDEHVASFDGPSPPLLIMGDSGSGKSALLANWWISREETLFKDPSILIVTHYVGSTVESTSHFSLMRRVMLEIKRHLYLPQEIPSDSKEIMKMFPTLINIISGRCKMVLVIDALNQLEDRADAFSLSWLPTVFPENVRVFVSTLPGPGGKLKKICEERSWPVLNITPLTSEEADELIVSYLSQYGKTMDAPLRAKIANSPGGRSPLFVRSLLEELRMSALFMTLSSKIDYYLTATTNEQFFQLLLARLEEQYESTENNTRNVMSIIFTSVWSSRQGVSEKELLALTGLSRFVMAHIFTGNEFNRLCYCLHRANELC